MIHLMTREWEIARHYVLNVELKHGQVNMNWEDFMTIARDHRPVAAVDVCDSLTLGQLFTLAYNEANALLKHRPTKLIINIENSNSNPLTMHDMEELVPAVQGVLNCEQQFTWGITPAPRPQESDLPDTPDTRTEASDERRLMLYLFE